MPQSRATRLLLAAVVVFFILSTVYHTTSLIAASTWIKAKDDVTNRVSNLMFQRVNMLNVLTG